MKKFSLIMAGMILFAGVSFAQQNPDPDPAHGMHKSNNTNKSATKAPVKKDDKKADKKTTNAPATK